MELTKEQVQQLFEFTEKKRVYWYDLQAELVDHLASTIEAKLTTDPSLSFERALEQTYQAFGIFGFAKVVQEKSTQVQKAASKLWWKEFYAFLSWPKVSFVVMCLVLVWHLTLYLDKNILMLACILGFAVSKFYTLWLTKKRKSVKKLMLLQFSFVHFTMFPLVYQSFLWNNDEHIPAVVIIFSMLGILTEATSIALYKKVHQQALTLYPEAFVTSYYEGQE